MIPAKTLADLQWPQLLEHLARRCHTARGAERAVALPLLDAPDDARARLGRVAELQALRAVDEAPPFGGIETVDAPVARASKGGALDAPELLAVARTLAGASRLRRHLVAHAALAPAMAALAEAMPDLGRDIAEPILGAFDDDGRLADRASERLRALRARVAKLQDDLIGRARGLMNDPSVASELQDRFYTRREGRVVVPIRTDAPSRIKGIVHGKSQSGSTLWVEPTAFVELNNGLALAELEVAEEERRILAEMSDWLRADAERIQRAIEQATEIDLLDASARMADAMAGVEPIIAVRGAFDLRAGRHPLMVLSQRPCVANDLAVADGALLVVSGPNAGGKTVALKTLGLAAVMARAGLPIAAAAGSHVPWCDTVLTDIGDDQSLERDLSTFSAHVMHLIEMLDAASPDTLVLVDEIAVGTAPEQGAVLAQAVLEALADRGCRAVVTTHYEGVKGLAAADPRFLSAAVGFDMDRLEPTFKVHMGAPGSSGGLVVARRLGLPAAIVERAEALLGTERASIDELLAEAQRERARLAEEAEALAAARAEVERDQRAAAEARRVAEQRAEQARESAHDEAVAALRRARDELEQIKTQLKKRKQVELPSARAAIDRLASEVAAGAPPRGRPAGDAPRPDALTVGARVTVASLGGRGEIVSAPVGDKVTVQLGALRTTVPIAEVRLVPGGKPAAAPAPAPSKGRGRGGLALETSGEDLAPARTRDTTLDVRGERVDDAIGRLERFLDEAMLAEREVVFVIHGHGTGALRSAVRQEAGLHTAVARVRPGEPNQGGDGVTVIFMHD